MTALRPLSARSTVSTTVQRAQSRWTVALAVLGGAYIAVFVLVAVVRLRYPYELEWMEGGVVDNVGRVLHGHSLYGPPSIRFTPYIYTPLYYVVGAIAAKTVGLGYAPLRFVSIVAALASFGAVAAWVRTETGDRWAPLVGAGLFAASYRVGGAWFDLAREDSLMLALLLWGLVAARRARSPRAFAVAGGLLGLAVLTKQPALLPALAVVPWALRAGRRSAAAYVGALAVAIGVPAVALQLASHGWFATYTVALPSGHALVPSAWLSFWTHDLLRPFAIAGAASVAVLVVRWRTPAGRWFLLPVVAALGLSAYSSRLHSGGYANVLLPAYAGIAVLFGVAAAEGVSLRRRPWLTALLAAQLVLLAYNPVAQLPSSADRRGGDVLLAELRSLHGSIYLPGHGWYLERTGHEGNSQSAAIEDVLRVPGAPGRDHLRAELRDAIDREAFDYVVVDSSSAYSYLPKDFKQHYQLLRRLRPRALPVTGTRTAPGSIWERIP